MTAATTSFSRFDLSATLRDVTPELEIALESGNSEQQATAERLRAITKFLELAGFAQIHLTNSYGDVDEAIDELYEEDYADVDDPVGDSKSQIRQAYEYFSQLQDQGSVFMVDELDAISRDTYRNKIQQLDDELSAFETLNERLVPLRDELEVFQDDVDEYIQTDFSTDDSSGTPEPIEIDADFPSEGFDNIRSALSDAPQPPSVETWLSDLVCITRSLTDGSEEMQDVVAAREDRSNNLAEQMEEDAAEEFRECDLTEERIRPVERLIGSFDLD